MKLATDLLVGAVDNNYDTAVLIRSDTDIVPAIEWIRDRFHKKVEYIGFSLPETEKHEATRPVKTMIYKTDLQRVLAEQDIRKFFKQKLL